MDILLCDELRLTYALLLQAAILIGAWRFVSRRLNTDWADRVADVLLLSLLVQYVSVTLPGLIGVLSPLSIALTSLAIAAGLYWAPSGAAAAAIPKGSIESPANRWTLLLCTLVALGYIACIAIDQRSLPVISNDALTYHFPAAVQWLRTGRLALFEPWFFNPANSYSPLAGSAFIAWWIAPLGNDVLARLEQFPALVLIFFASLRLMRALGATALVAAIIALGLLVSRPLLRQAVIEKDDLYLAAFFTCFVAACLQDRLRDPPLGPLRAGAALGLMLATKYNALLALPAIILLVDAPLRARWRLGAYLTALSAALVLAGPWYIRNFVMTGNPVFPIQVKLFGATLFSGLFSSGRSARFADSPIFTLLTTGDQGLPPALLAALLLAIVAAVASGFGRLKSDPVVRLCLLGPFILFVMFITACPYAEVRYLLPAVVLLFAAAAFAIATCLNHLVAAQIVAASVIAFICWITTWSLRTLAIIAPDLLITTAIVTLGGASIAWGLRRSKRPGVAAAGIALTAATVLAGAIYVLWSAYLQNCRDWAIECYRSQYGDAADVWKFVRAELPPEQTLAYTNTYFIYPMEGFDHARRLIYIPTRRGMAHLRDLPPIPGKPSGEELMTAVAGALTSDTDQDAWLANLAASHATHLVVFKHDVVPNPPELAIIRAHASQFETIFQNDAAIVFRLKR